MIFLLLLLMGAAFLVAVFFRKGAGWQLRTAFLALAAGSIAISANSYGDAQLAEASGTSAGSGWFGAWEPVVLLAVVIAALVVGAIILRMGRRTG